MRKCNLFQSPKSTYIQQQESRITLGLGENKQELNYRTRPSAHTFQPETVLPAHRAAKKDNEQKFLRH